MSKIDYRKEYGDWYTAATAKPKLVMLSPLNYLMIDGKGDPNTSVEYQQAVEAIYPVAYGIKFKIKRESGLDYGVLPLQGLWWVPDMDLFSTSSKDDWLWTAMILQPPVVTEELFIETLAEVRKKKKDLAGLTKVRFESYHEGQAAQIMHIGPYADEAPTIQKLHEFILSQGYILQGKHHEIYLGDPRRTAPERLRTIIRQPFGTSAD
jgi:hypothetical protein